MEERRQYKEFQTQTSYIETVLAINFKILPGAAFADVAYLDSSRVKIHTYLVLPIFSTE